MDWERNHTPSSFEDLQLSISHCDVDQVWHFLSQKPARPQIDLVVQQFSISHRVHVWWRFVISKRTLQKKMNKSDTKKTNPRKHQTTPLVLLWTLFGFAWLHCSGHVVFFLWSYATRPHQIIKLVELCQGRFVVENLLSSALAHWKDLLESEGWKPQGIDRPSCQTATERPRSRNSGAWHPIDWTPSGQMDMGQSHRRCWHADSQRRPHVAERETKNT